MLKYLCLFTRLALFTCLTCFCFKRNFPSTSKFSLIRFSLFFRRGQSNKYVTYLLRSCSAPFMVHLITSLQGKYFFLMFKFQSNPTTKPSVSASSKCFKNVSSFDGANRSLESLHNISQAYCIPTWSANRTSSCIVLSYKILPIV